MKAPFFSTLCAVLYMACNALFAQNSPPNTQNVLPLLQQASSASSKGNYLRTIQLYTQIIGMQPDEAKYYFYRGQAHMMIHEGDKALSDYNKSIALTPQFFDAYLSRAILFFNINEPEKSINDYNMALRYCQDTMMRIYVFNNRGNAKSMRNDLQGAYLDYLEAYRLDGNFVATLSNVSNILNRMNRGSEALMFLKRILEIEPKNISIRADMGYAYMNMNLYQEAVEQYNIVLASEPNEAISLSNRGLAKFNLQEYDSALADMNRSVALLPQNAYAYRNRGMLLMSMGDKSASCNDFAKALRHGFTEKYDDEVGLLFRRHCTEGSK
jgi:tetratricopeptide (TPR) repeat protein